MIWLMLIWFILWVIHGCWVERRMKDILAMMREKED